MSKPGTVAPFTCWVALVCEYRGWLLGAAGWALSPRRRDGLGGVATRHGWVLANPWRFTVCAGPSSGQTHGYRTTGNSAATPTGTPATG